jgi:hypothetical protein
MEHTYPRGFPKETTEPVIRNYAKGYISTSDKIEQQTMYKNRDPFIFLHLLYIW